MHMSWLFVALTVSLKSKILAKSRALNGDGIFDPRNRATKGFLRSWGVAAGPLARSLVARSINPPLSSGTPRFHNWVKHTVRMSLSLPSLSCEDCHYHHAWSCKQCKPLSESVGSPVLAPGPRREKMGSGGERRTRTPRPS